MLCYKSAVHYKLQIQIKKDLYTANSTHREHSNVVYCLIVFYVECVMFDNRVVWFYELR